MTNEETISMGSDVISDETLKENLKKRLELELGLPLTPQVKKQIEQNFDGKVILLQEFPVQSITLLRIGGMIIGSDDYILNESEGCIYLNAYYAGTLYLEYTYCLNESEYMPILDLMLEYEKDNSWNKNASSIKENNVTVSFDTSVGKAARIQSMISDLRNRYSCYVELI